jgi:glucose-1-phosphate cytidylyltransferase
MKIIILCGGLGTRILEETKRIPKPMVLIGNKPILWHIINIYLKFKFNDFFLAIGYKGQYIKSYFSRFQIKKLANVKCVNTGKKTMTGGRLLKFKKFIKKNETFMVTYGDGVSNININELIKKVKFASNTLERTKGLMFEDKKKFDYSLSGMDDDICSCTLLTCDILFMF